MNERERAVELAGSHARCNQAICVVPNGVRECDMARALLGAEAEIAELRNRYAMRLSAIQISEEFRKVPSSGVLAQVAYSTVDAYAAETQKLRSECERLRGELTRCMERKKNTKQQAYEFQQECEKLRAEVEELRDKVNEEDRRISLKQADKVYAERDELRAALAVAVSHSHGPTWCTACDDDVAQCPLGSIPAIAREKERRGKVEKVVEAARVVAETWASDHAKPGTVVGNLHIALAALGDAE